MSLTFCQCGQIKGNCGCKPTNQPDYRTTTERGYGYDWQQLSKRFRAEHPLCWRCLAHGKTVPTEHVHHIIPIEIDPDRRLDWDNLAALCKPCHDIEDINAKEGRPFEYRPEGTTGRGR